jgi:hypothetical protein
MSVKQSLYLKFDVEVFNTDEVKEAQRLANELSGVLYCWKTTCNSNWLEKGLSIVDVLGVVILPQGLPDQICMPNDEKEEC